MGHKIMRPVENWRAAWRFYSVRLAALAGVVAGYLAANPDQTQALLDVLPDGPLRVLASIGIGVFVFGLATGTRLARQGKAEGGE